MKYLWCSLRLLLSKLVFFLVHICHFDCKLAFYSWTSIFFPKWVCKHSKQKLDVNKWSKKVKFLWPMCKEIDVISLLDKHKTLMLIFFMKKLENWVKLQVMLKSWIPQYGQFDNAAELSILCTIYFSTQNAQNVCTTVSHKETSLLPVGNLKDH